MCLSSPSVCDRLVRLVGLRTGCATSLGCCLFRHGDGVGLKIGTGNTRVGRWCYMRREIQLATVAALVVILAACGSSASSSKGASTSSKGTVNVDRTSSFGPIIDTATGSTLYIFEADGEGKNNSVCYGACATTWPPLTVSATPTAGNAVDASKLGTIVRTDGKHQVTYAGYPLYTYAYDSGPHQTNGEGILEFWYLLSSSGQVVTTPVRP